ncbi:MAG TPA: hypothetical protein PKL75_11775 [Treponemataceae bacterium]|nr:hypothetical protein [Treponemataceae bacterium]
MKPNRVFAFAVVTLAFLAGIFPAAAQEAAQGAAQESVPATVRVSTVRIFIGEAKYDWTGDGIAFDAASVPSGTRTQLKPETIRSFLSVRPGLIVAPRDLERRCLDSERRLIESGYVYEASVLPLPSKNGAVERLIVVSVTEGFFGRFGGGGIWAMAGKAGLFGDRASALFWAGYNRNGFSVLHSDVGGTPLALGARLFYYGPGDYDGKTAGSRENCFYGALSAGWYLGPDLLVGIDGALDHFGPSSTGLFSLQPCVFLNRYIAWGAKSAWGGEARGYWYPDLEMTKADCTAHARAGFTEKARVALSGSVGYSADDLPTDACFDLYYAEDRSVRSGYSTDELIGSRYALASAELRYDFLSFKVPPAFPCTVQGFLFSDVAAIDPADCDADGGADSSAASGPLDAYGLGARVIFDNPVFAYFTFTYGVNHEGDGRFIFCGTAGY